MGMAGRTWATIVRGNCADDEGAMPPFILKDGCEGGDMFLVGAHRDRVTRTRGPWRKTKRCDMSDKEALKYSGLPMAKSNMS